MPETDTKNLFKEFPSVVTTEWVNAINKDLKGADFDSKMVWKTSEGFNLNPFYREEDILNLKY
ncbi:MAG: methylmalonyl-CoA mutase small subunit, partial [Bacteroidetes bacterium]|nr:methylmalonyl-CoA mutase small subunit [Bacteroidota bacterium]